MPEISVVIPCFNQGRFLDQAIQSVLAQTFHDFEIIVVNDGSTDLETIEKLNALDYPKTRVFHTANLGLPGARNLAIRNAAGEFILPLDADDKIAPTYLEVARAVITSDRGIGIVYCKAAFFGEVSIPWNIPEYQFPEILISPRIHCCSLFRKADWESVGGYCEEMIHGWEDYDLWLSLLEGGLGVHCVSEVLFYYRQHPESMTKEQTVNRHQELFGKIYERHRDLYHNSMAALLRLSFNLAGSTFGLKEEVGHLVRCMASSDLGHKQEVTRLEEDSVSLQGHISALEEIILSLQGKSSELEKSVLSLQGHISALEEIILSLKGRISALTNNISELEQINLSLRSTVSGLEQNNLLLSSAAERLENKGSQMRQSLSWRITSPLRRLAHLFSWKDGVVSNINTEILLIVWRILLRLPLTRRANDLRSQVRQLATSGLFDSPWYRVEYEAMPGVDGHPILHYLLIGAKRGCNPNPLFATNWYLRAHPEAAASGMNPLLHYAEFGAKNHMGPNPKFDARS